MVFDVEKRLVFMLSVQINEEFAHLLEQQRRHRRVIHEAAALSPCGNLPRQSVLQFAQARSVRGTAGAFCFPPREDSFHSCLFRPAPDKSEVAPLTKDQTERINDDGFPGSRLTSQND